ncbi:hypothetical protein [Pseudomonas sp. KCJK9111]|uniref:hypothetical protein n=1 Tax=Pseudomonas sp. KCJK9111 TaxID=3344555 RepID=UPI0039063CA2
MRELYPFRAELKAFAQALLAHLPENESARLVSRVSRYYSQGEDPATALATGLLVAEKGKPLDHPVFMAVDVRGFDDFEYLAPKLVEASGIERPYTYTQEGTPTMAQVLVDFDQWLIGAGKRFLHVDMGGSDYVGCIVNQECVDSLIALAKVAGTDAQLDPF